MTEMEQQLAACLTELVERSDRQSTQLTKLVELFTDVHNRLSHLETQLARFGISTRPTS